MILTCSSDWHCQGGSISPKATQLIFVSPSKVRHRSMRRLITICLLGLASIGCKTDPHATREIALLRSEILDLEDQYYALKAKYRHVAEDLRDCKGEPDDPSLYNDGPTFYDNSAPYCEDPVLSYRDEIFIDGTNSSPQYREPRLTPNREELPPPNNQLPSPNRLPGEPSQTRPDDNSNTQDTRWDTDQPIQLEGFQANDQFRKASTVMEVASVSINESATRGVNLDNVAGDEGLVLLIQPKSDSGTVLQTPGDLTVTILDPNERRNQEQIGMWQFGASEVPNFFVRDELIQQGILLHLPWNTQTPRNRNLLVNVAFTDSTQRKHETSFEINIMPPPENYSPDDSLIAEWLENDSRWVDLSYPGPMPAEMTGNPNGNDRTPSSAAAMKSTRRSAPNWRPVR